MPLLAMLSEGASPCAPWECGISRRGACTDAPRAPRGSGRSGKWQPLDADPVAVGPRPDEGLAFGGKIIDTWGAIYKCGKASSADEFTAGDAGGG